MTPTAIAWLILIGGFVLPTLHVAVSPKSGPWHPPAESRCPIGPRLGWLVMVVLLGPLGWLLYLRGREKTGRVRT